jgi:beta-lactam-binding protein with PASTA domain/tRNA A-37 threonylcarbamoyl transferase component Bud32
VTTAGSTSLIEHVLDGRYRVLSHLADGGMATVYVALDLRLDRKVALKVMRSDLAKDETFVSRFRREARSAAKLSHPNVVAVYDQGEDEGNVFLTMELVNGLTLRQVMQAEGPLTPRAALDIIDPVLQALGAAHSAGLIHRDVKPENVILREDGTVKVADFGLARAIATTTSTAQTGVLLGTVAYLSPEQVERGQADARSDVYAAGLLLFEMLAGSKAFIGDSPIHVAYQHVHSEVPAPSSRINTVPAALDQLVARASARNPDDRPRDANQMLSEVRQARQLLSSAELDLRPADASSAAAVNLTIAIPRTEVVSPVDAPGQWGAGAGRRAGLLRKASWRGRTWPVVVLALILLAAAAALLFFLAGPGASTTVPKVAGSTTQVAELALTNAHLSAKVVRSFDETTRAGVVLVADPPAGREVGRGSTVILTVSQGQERHAVPKLVGRSQAEAEQRLTDAKLAAGKVTEAFSETVPQGQVISTSPVADTSVKRATPVALVISQGRQPIQVTDWTGKPADQAIKALTGAKLKVDATKADWSDTVPAGAVLSQSPATGTLFLGDPVVLVVSKGPQLVAVPDVFSKKVGDAKALLAGLGFMVKIDTVLGGLLGFVKSQTIPAGTLAPSGSTITLVVV